MMLRGNAGFGYVRLDWFTPQRVGDLGRWAVVHPGDRRLHRMRKYADIAGRKGGNHLFVVDAKEARYIDCNNLTLPFGPQFISDVVNRTHTRRTRNSACWRRSW
jgi:hypothetical protein